MTEYNDSHQTTSFTVVLFLGLIGGTFGLLNHYKSSYVPLLTSSVVFLSWLLGFSGALLLPADLADAQYGKSSYFILVVWYIVFWTTFVMSWGLIPILMEYTYAGGFSVRSKLVASLRANAKFYLIIGVALVVIGIYVGVVRGLGVSEFLGLLMTAGNTYGLLFIVVFMGYGLVTLPRRLWQLSSLTDRKLRLEFHAPLIDNELHDAKYELDDAEGEAHKVCREAAQLVLADPSLNTLKSAVVTVLSKCRSAAGIEVEVSVVRARGGSAPSPSNTTTEDQLVKALTTCHRRLMIAVVKRRRAELRWEELLDEAEELTDRLEGKVPPPVLVDRSVGHLYRYLRDMTSWLWRVRLSSKVYQALSVLCSILSILLVWSEATLASRRLSPFAAVMDGAELGVQFTAFVALGYMSVCTFFSLFRLKLFGQMHLHGNHQSDAYSLLFNAAYLCRLQFPLGYHFLLMVRDSDASQSTRFKTVMNGMDVVPILGTNFNVYAPIVMLIVCCFTLCHGYARLLRLVGLEHIDDFKVGRAEDDERVEEGRGLIRQGQVRRNRNRRTRRATSEDSSDDESSLSSGDRLRGIARKPGGDGQVASTGVAFAYNQL